MARFRCPSASSTEATHSRSVTPRPNPSGPRKDDDRQTPQPEPRKTFRPPATPTHRKRDKGKGRHTSVKPKDVDRVRLCVKKEIVKSRVGDHKMSFIYVGNLDHTITVSDLKEVFSGVGDVVRVLIRALGGQVSAFRPGGKNVKSQLYATVEFRKPIIVRRALQLHGTEVKGIKLVVAKDVLELNEFLRIITRHHARQNMKLAPKLLFKQGWEKIKSLTVERTERIDDQPESVKDFPLANKPFPRFIGGDE